MAKITFVILAHENADQVADLAELLTKWDADAHAVIHYDRNSGPRQFEQLVEKTGRLDRVHLVKDRIKCSWGDFSLVDAVVRALRVIRDSKIACDRVMLVSGACMPVRPLAEFSAYLDANPDSEFIEAHNSDWIVGGLRKERYQYWHFFNFQKQHHFFNAHYHIQRRIWPTRGFPAGLEPRFGSQWWCLSWKLCERILTYIKKHPLKYFFFSTVWIPDELFFQTMAYKFAASRITNRNLTFFHFNEKGRPYTFLDDHLDHILNLPFFFARKISPRAGVLKGKLKEIAQQPAPAELLKIDFKEKYRFPFNELLQAQLPANVQFSRRLFQPKGDSCWEDMLSTCPYSMIVLHGPPQLTRPVANVLLANPHLDVLGRVFKPDEVEFGDGRTEFKGLKSDQHLIRDYDPPTYFRRVLDRCDGIPVIEFCPGDNVQAEKALLSSKNAIVIPIMPEEDDEVARNFYWILAADPVLSFKRNPELRQRLNQQLSRISLYKTMVDVAYYCHWIEYRQTIETYMSKATQLEPISVEDWGRKLLLQHGADVATIVDYLPAMKAALDKVDIMHQTPTVGHWAEAVSDLCSEYGQKWKIVRLNNGIHV